MKALCKFFQGVLNVLYLVIGMFIVAILFVGSDIPLWQKLATFIGGLAIMFFLKLLSGYIGKKAD